VKAFLPVALLVLCTANIRAQDPSPVAAPGVTPMPVARIAGVAVIREVLESRTGKYRPFGMETGTRVSLVFHSPSLRLVGLDPVASRIESFADDAGTNLLALSHRLQEPGFLERGFGIMADGNLAHVEIYGGTPPARGASRLALHGKVVFLTASTRSLAVSAPSETGLGKEFQVGGKFVFTTTRWATADGKSTSVSLSCDGNPLQFAAFRFLGADGKEIASRAARWDSWNNCREKKPVFHFQLSAHPKTCALEVSCWNDLRPLDADIHLTTGLGD
jgi:hypothetical protein